MKRFVFISLALTLSLSASSGNIEGPLDLACEVWSVMPSEIQNPKAEDWWSTQSKMDGVTLDINSHGIHLLGAMVDRTWETYTGDVTDWNIIIKFNGPYEAGGKYNRISLSTLTGGGFFFVNYRDGGDNDPNYKVTCEQAVEAEQQESIT